MNVMDESQERIAGAGLDILRIGEAGVLIKVDDIPEDQLWRHPVWALCRGLGALGFGGIHLRGAADYFEDLAVLMHGTHFTQEPGLWVADAMAEHAPAADIVVDLTNDPVSKTMSAGLSLSRSCAVVSLTWGRTWVGLSCTPDAAVTAAEAGRVRDAGEMPLPAISRLAAGLALQETLMVASGIDGAAPPDRMVVYDAASESRTGVGRGEPWPGVAIQDATLHVIGIGAIGTNLVESLAPMLGSGCTLALWDFDEVGPENLAVQAAFSVEDVGRPKAIVMAEKLARTCDPALDIRAMVARYEDRPPDDVRPALRVACPDTFEAREFVNSVSVADGVPLVEAGVSPLACQVRSYLPGTTACLAHRIANLRDKVRAEQDRASCADPEALTLPGTSMVCGGMLAIEAVRALRPNVYGPPSKGTVVYDGRFPQRFGVIDIRPPCTHGRRSS